MRTLPFTKEKLEEIAQKWPTPFHIYDAAAIRRNAERLKKAFAWNAGFREYFAVKAAPNPHLMKLLKEFGFGSDCSSMAELILAEKTGNTGEAIMFTSNDTPAEEFSKALELGAIVNFDDITHIDFLRENCGSLPEIACCRYNPGPLKGGNAIIGKPEEAKYGFTREQLVEAYSKMKAKGVKRFGLHTMVASNELDPEYIIDTAKLLFALVGEITIGVKVYVCAEAAVLETVVAVIAPSNIKACALWYIDNLWYGIEEIIGGNRCLVDSLGLTVVISKSKFVNE